MKALENLDKFQSLLGIIVNWNLASVKVSSVSPMFQSLLGIIVNWNLPGQVTIFYDLVSIPARDYC